MTAATDRPDFTVVIDDRILWHLSSGTKIREIGAHGRIFIADSRTPGRVWRTAHTSPTSPPSRCPWRSAVASDEHDDGQLSDHAYELELDRILGITP